MESTVLQSIRPRGTVRGYIVHIAHDCIALYVCMCRSTFQHWCVFLSFNCVCLSVCFELMRVDTFTEIRYVSRYTLADPRSWTVCHQIQPDSVSAIQRQSSYLHSRVWQTHTLTRTPVHVASGFQSVCHSCWYVLGATVADGILVLTGLKITLVVCVAVGLYCTTCVAALKKKTLTTLEL